MNKVPVNIEILGKTYQIKCAENEVEALQKAASVLDEKMQKVQSTGNLINFDRVAVLAALNLTHQVLHLEQQSHQMAQSVQQRLQELQTKVEAALARNAQMEFASE